MWVDAKGNKTSSRFYNVLTFEFTTRFGPLDDTTSVKDADNDTDGNNDFDDVPVGLYRALGSNADSEVAAAKKTSAFGLTRKVCGLVSPLQ